MISLLIVDDEFRTREGLASLIERSGLPVFIAGKASNGAEGLAMAKTLCPDIIITDVRMPRMNGIALSAEFRKLNPACQIIFISGYSDKEYLKSAISLKAVSYVEKPFDSSELLDALRTALHSIEENKQKELIQKQHGSMFREKIVLELISPHPAAEYLEKLPAFYPDFATYPCYYSLICQIDNSPASKTDDPAGVQDLLWTILHSHGFPFLLAPKEPHVFIMHLNLPPSESILNEIASGLHEALSDRTDAFLAVGSPVSSFGQLYLSYLNAVICLRKLFFLGYHHLCFYSSRDNEMGSPFEPDASLLREYDQALRDDDIGKMTAVTSALFNSMRKTIYKFEINSIRDVYYQLLISLSSICRERRMQTVFSHDDAYIWEMVTQKDTIYALQDYLMEKLVLYTQELNAKKGSSQLAHRICQYIERHYNDTDLTVNKMAGELHFTPAYLCQIFKAETGNTINSYINTFRVDKAKSLLKSKESKLYEVSLNVGYKNPDYFTIQFKKRVGMTPSEFREKYIL
ncbi:MAG TPA: response regulator [Candidatus Eisenbergiella merdipullorum]|uniref:Stage 0 sporulation protein A homolog n=1 Tax=Candidatus Eisenbergiella merdipullorum TaxID=2838553 RepID=A0A9D2L2B1_9FIRM|nr:response regulator [Candidatus Eisenbergiella merdipullorum]